MLNWNVTNNDGNKFNAHGSGEHWKMPENIVFRFQFSFVQFLFSNTQKFIFYFPKHFKMPYYYTWVNGDIGRMFYFPVIIFSSWQLNIYHSNPQLSTDDSWEYNEAFKEARLTWVIDCLLGVLSAGVRFIAYL